MINKDINYLILIAITFTVVMLLSFISRKILDLIIKKNSLKINTDPTNFIFLKNSIPFILFAIGIFWVFQKIPFFKSLGTALFAGAGVLAAIIGFASQKAFSNIVGGLFILIFKPFRVGDVVEISNTRRGIIEEITLRHTIIRDYEHRRIVIPNSQISEETIVNSSITDDKIRKRLEVSVSYESDIDLAIELLEKTIREHPNFLDMRSPAEIEVGIADIVTKVVEHGDSAIKLRTFVWAADSDHAHNLTCDILKDIIKIYNEAGIDIPYPYTNVVIKK